MQAHCWWIPLEESKTQRTFHMRITGELFQALICQVHASSSHGLFSKENNSGAWSGTAYCTEETKEQCGCLKVDIVPSLGSDCRWTTLVSRTEQDSWRPGKMERRKKNKSCSELQVLDKVRRTRWNVQGDAKTWELSKNTWWYNDRTM